MAKPVSYGDGLPPSRYTRRLWAIRWIGVPIGYLLSPDEREEWLGDLKEIQHRMIHAERYPIWFVNSVTSAKCLCLIVSKIQSLVVETVSQIIALR